MKALFEIAGSGFFSFRNNSFDSVPQHCNPRWQCRRSSTLTPGAGSKTAEQTNVQKDSSFYNGTTSGALPLPAAFRGLSRPTPRRRAAPTGCTPRL